MASDHFPENSFTTPREHIPGVPDFGWRVKKDYECKVKCAPFVQPRLSQIPSLVGLGVRYMKVWLRHKRQGRKMFIDHLDQVAHKAIYGCPIGGIGCGTIGRGYRGEFCRFQMVPGIYDYKVVQANQFVLCIRKDNKTVYQKVLTGKKDKKSLGAWEWGFPHENATYHALYPRSWTVYDIPEYKLRLTCRQVSPIFPNDYKDTSFPMAVFVWTVENNGSEPIDISIMFTFKNGRGVKEDGIGGCVNEAINVDKDDTKVHGVTLQQKIRDMKCTYAVAGKCTKDTEVTHKLHFDPKGRGQEIWEDLREDGKLNSEPDPKDKPGAAAAMLSFFVQLLLTIVEVFLNLITIPTGGGRKVVARKGHESAAAVCIKTTVPAGQTRDLEFTLTWDMPVIHFKSRELLYARRYSRWFGTEGDACSELCHYALQNYPQWEQKIEAWQNPILQNKNLPAWYKSALFNELYFVSDGGTVWIDPVERKDGKIVRVASHLDNPLVEDYGLFAYLEGHEYRMYNTYDVHHYASFALIMLWPKLQLSLQYDIAHCVMSEDTTRIRFCMEGILGNRKNKNAVPHDIGDPEDEPWIRQNAYIIHPTYDWKDLNMKFVLQSYRDFAATKDSTYLSIMYPVVKEVGLFNLCLSKPVHATEFTVQGGKTIIGNPLCNIGQVASGVSTAQTVIESAKRWDVDDDGIIDNGGFADQTFDAWTMTGASAYCGGMWLAALRMAVEMATILGKEEDAKSYQTLLDKGKKSFEKKLWNGKYYNYDCSTGGHHDSIMADQLAGHWFLKASDLADNTIFPPDHVKTTLQTVFKYNVKGFHNGNFGAINGVRPDGSKDLSSCQSEEFWVGVTYGVAASMIQEGLVEEAFQTAWGSYHVCWEWYGLAFQTPEAYMTDNIYRSLGYMRPLAIWSMQWALEKYQPQLLSS